MNLSYVDFSLVGDLDGGGDSVRCHTNLPNCCSHEEGGLRGDWLFPDGMKLPFNSHAGVYQARTAQRVDLRHSRGTPVTGIYCCIIPYDAGDTLMRATLCVRIGKTGFVLLFYLPRFVHTNIFTHSLGNNYYPGQERVLWLLL